MRMRKIYTLALLIIFTFITGGVVAKTDHDSLITKAEEYFRDFDTAQARFVQTAPNGAQLVGTFYLDRPGKLRFEYDPPVEDFVVADGFFLYFYDSELESQSNAPIGQTLADFILREDLKLRGDLSVTDIRDDTDLIQITAVQTDDPEAGSIMLGFEREPFDLKKWRITDAQGQITEVELFYLKTGIRHPNGLFVYKDPKAGTERFNQ